MNRKENNLLTPYELMFTIVGTMIGTGLLSLASDVVKYAKQDGWVSAIIGSIYPFYLVFTASILIKRYPDQNIIELSKKFLGKFIGTILNVPFMFFFLIYVVGILSHAINILLIFAIWFMTPPKIALVMSILVVYINTKGLKVLSRVNVLSFFIICFVVILTLVAFKYGSILNIQPVFGSGPMNILKSSFDTVFSYGGVEILFLIYPFVRERKNTVKFSAIGVAISAFIFTWVVFTTIFYLSTDIVSKAFWPLFFVTESVKIPVISNFRFVFMSIWIIVIFKGISNFFYGFTSVLNNVTHIDRKKLCIFVLPVIFYLPLLFTNEVYRRDFFGSIVPFSTLYNLLYITLIALLALFKSSSKTKKNKIKKEDAN